MAGSYSMLPNGLKRVKKADGTVLDVPHDEAALQSAGYVPEEPGLDPLAGDGFQRSMGGARTDDVGIDAGYAAYDEQVGPANPVIHTEDMDAQFDPMAEPDIKSSGAGSIYGDVEAPDLGPDRRVAALEGSVFDAGTEVPEASDAGGQEAEMGDRAHQDDVEREHRAKVMAQEAGLTNPDGTVSRGRVGKSAPVTEAKPGAAPGKLRFPTRPGGEQPRPPPGVVRGRLTKEEADVLYAKYRRANPGSAGYRVKVRDEGYRPGARTVKRAQLTPEEAEQRAIEIDGTAAEREELIARRMEEEGEAAKARAAAHQAEQARLKEQQQEQERRARDVERQVSDRMAAVDERIANAPDVDPGRYWANQNTLMKIISVAGIIAGELTGNRRPSELVTKAVDDDIQQQEKALARHRGKTGDMRNALGDYIRIHGTPEAAKAELRLTGLKLAEARMQELQSKTTSQQRRAQLQDAILDIQKEAAQQKMQLTMASRDQVAESYQYRDAEYRSVGGRRALSRKEWEQGVNAEGFVVGGGKKGDGVDKGLRDRQGRTVTLPGGAQGDAATVEEAKTLREGIAAYKSMEDKANRIKQVLKDYAAGKMTREAAKSRLASLGGQLLMGVKKSENLGALDAGAERQGDRIVGSPERLLSIADQLKRGTYGGTDPSKTLDEYIKNKKKELGRNFGSKMYKPGTTTPFRHNEGSKTKPLPRVR